MMLTIWTESLKCQRAIYLIFIEKCNKKLISLSMSNIKEDMKILQEQNHFI